MNKEQLWKILLKTDEGTWAFVGYLFAEDHTTVELHLNSLASRLQTPTRAVLDSYDVRVQKSETL